MMWVIASIPLWIVGTVLILMGLAAMAYPLTGSRRYRPTTDQEAKCALGGLMFIAIAAIFFLLAAKVVS